MNYNYIAIEGCIGAGKTTLAKELAKHFSSQLILERFKNNPFLANFYLDKTRYAFQTELFFLMERYNQLSALKTSVNTLHISDYMFAKCKLFADVNLSNQAEINLYKELYRIIEKQLVVPDILIYLNATPQWLLNNIEKRNRTMEKHITIDYLNEVNQQYVNYFKDLDDYPVLIVNSADIDVINNDNQMAFITNLLHKQWKPGINYL